MRKHGLLDEVVKTVYAVDIGLSDEDGVRMFSRMLQSVEWRRKNSPEIEAAFADRNFSWADFFEGHDLFSADSEGEALDYARKLLLEPLQAGRQA